MSIKTLALSALVLLSVAMPAAAAETDEARSSTVTFPRTDLVTEAGRARIDARLMRAAGRVCPLDSARQLMDRPVAVACRTKAIADARRMLAQHVAAAANERVQVATIDTAAPQR